MTIKLIEQFSVSQARDFIRNSLQWNGEQCILLQAYHVNSGLGHEVPPRCPDCFDDEYMQGNRATCTKCWGTTFLGGIRSAQRVWALFSDKAVSEQLGQKGVWTPDQREIQCEPFPELMEHDFVVRVRTWDSNNRPTEIEGFYAVKAVTRNSVRTGNRFGQWQWDVIGQRAQISELQRNSGICQYPILGQDFSGANMVIQPDSKIIYVPTGSGSGGGLPSNTAQVYSYTQNTALATWTISHTLKSTSPSVTVVVNGEEVEADVSYPNTTTVVVTFADPQTGAAILIG